VIKSVADQLGNKITIKFPPQRIVSLVPSQTELLSALNADREVIGITKFCIHPESWHASKIIVGGTKDFNIERITALNPDLIIGNKEENDQERIETLRKNFPVWMSDVTSYEDALAMIENIGDLTDRYAEARAIANEIRNAFQNLKKRTPQTVLYLIWRKPWMAAAKLTFINTMLETIGLRNCISDQERYPVLSASDIQSYRPEVVFLSSEPYPFRNVHAEEIRSLVPNAKIILVDGEMFSWYGSRMVLAPAYFSSLTLE